MSGKIVKYASTRFGIVRCSKGQSVIDYASYISRSVVKLYLPLVGAPNFYKAPHRDVLTNAGNVKQFLADERISSFAELEDYAEKAEQARHKSNQSYQSEAAKLRQLKEEQRKQGRRKKGMEL